MAGKTNQAVFYSWIDATCHSYFLKMFGIEPDSLPNVIFYKPSVQRFASVIGAFNEETILDH